MKALMIILTLIISLSYASYAQQSLCDYKVEILLNGTEFIKEEFKWRMKATKLQGTSTNITGTAEIIDSQGNSVKKYSPWKQESISRQKTSSTYSPNLNDGEYKIISKINVECDDANNYNNADIKIIKIKPENEGTKESLKETEYKTKISDVKTDATETKNEAAIFQNNETRELDMSDEFNDEIILTANKTEKNNEKITTNAIKENKIIYESSNEKARNLIVFFLLALSILLNIVLIWRR